MRRTLPMAITLIVGVIMIFRDLFVFPDFATFTQTYIVRSVTLSQASAVALGCLSLARLHLNRVMRQRDGWYNSLILLCGIAFFLIMGFLFDRGQNDAIYQYFYQMIPVQLSSMTFALLCFYIASSSYRAFRMRSLEAGLLLGSAVFVMMGSISVGNAIWSGFPQIKSWIMNNMNTPTVRGIGLGVTLGSLAQSARNLLGIERGYMAE